ncbi:hypothetical protein FPSE_10516 [Fusarium pseudograminearum CS3096]|uniref:Protein kinase domain-containing protein n=1 Tax=Fusarium pseudograminearum (strain CS3096) TaxID=1028729 RepID=K3VAR9_FUSPC|nr:hypothetical protein FPSE_10516 [Fusarium pseudograminearum CS3096]EKJ69263.1 hypothetical protein FPSE_10516 [Fusarium pseudograminearum CS3096]
MSKGLPGMKGLLPDLNIPSTGNRRRAVPSHLDNQFNSNDALLSPPANIAHQSETECVHDGGASKLSALEQQLPAETCPGTNDELMDQYHIIGQYKPVTVDKLSNAFWKEAETSAVGGKAKFLPLHKLKALINPDSAQELFESLSIPQHHVERLIRDIFTPHRPLEYHTARHGNDFKERPSLRRIFAILVGIGHVAEIQRFIDQGIDDSALPIIMVTEKEKLAGIEFRSMGDPHMDSEKLNQCFAQYSETHLNLFELYQKLINVPFFLFPGQDSTVCFYELERSCVLPIIYAGEPNVSGNGSVKQIAIHHAHHNHGGIWKRHSNDYFAVKTLHLQNNDRFQEEVEAFEKVSPKSKDKSPDHLVHLELAYRHGDDCCLVFPWASGNLKEYWKEHRKDPSNHEHVVWFFKQCWGLAVGLRRLHNPRSYALTTTDHDSNVHAVENTLDFKYGRHGDVKPANILWFDNYDGDPDHLAICDFGSTQFNHLDTKSHVDPGLVREYSITYQPPDRHTDDKVSPRFDIWSLGCVFLEFVSWFLLGYDLTVEEFPRRRAMTNQFSQEPIRKDEFYHFVCSKRNERQKVAKVNPGVLDPKASDRCDCLDARLQLQDMYNKCCRNQIYATAGYPKTPRRSRGILYSLTGFDIHSMFSSRRRAVREKINYSESYKCRHQTDTQHPDIFPKLADEMRISAPPPEQFEREIDEESETFNPRRKPLIETHNEESIIVTMPTHYTSENTGSSNGLLQMITSDTTPCLTEIDEVDADVRNSISEYPQDGAARSPCGNMTIESVLLFRQDGSSEIIGKGQAVGKSTPASTKENLEASREGDNPPRKETSVAEASAENPFQRPTVKRRTIASEEVKHIFEKGKNVESHSKTGGISHYKAMATMKCTNLLGGGLLESQNAPGTLIQIIDEVRELRNIIETIEPTLRGRQDPDNDGMERNVTSEQVSHSIKPIIINCLRGLQSLESQIRPERINELLESKGKAFLQALSWRLKGNDAKQSIANIQQCKASLTLAISSHNALVVRNIERLSLSIEHEAKQSSRRLDALATDLETSQCDEKQREIFNWLSPLKPGQNHHELKSAHQGGTAQWFHQSPEFQEWFSRRSTMLWLSGPPGSGKSVMMSQAIEEVASRVIQRSEPAAYAFVYSDFRDPATQDIVNIFGNLLCQLCSQTQLLPIQLLEAYESSIKDNCGYGPSIDMILGVIQKLSTNRRIYLLIDGVDEVKDYKSFSKRLTTLKDSSTSINILVASRNEVTIQRILAEAPRISLEDRILNIGQDIERYITVWLNNDLDLEWLSPEIKSLVSTSLMAKAKGKTTRDIKKCLSKLPEGLNETYGRLLTRTTPSGVALVKKIVTWLSFSSVPVTLHELWEALAIEKQSKNIDDEARLRSPQDIVILGHGLITVSSDGYAMLAHLSVRDYLLSDEISQDPDTAKFALHPRKSHLELAQDCLTYLSFSGLSSGPSNTQEDYLHRQKEMPLIQYASKYWFYHLRNAESDKELLKLCLEFFLPKSRNNFISWVQVFNATSPFKWNIFPRHATSLYYASSLGLDTVVQYLLKSSAVDEIDAPGSRFGGTAVHAAALRDHLDIVKRLAKAGADPGKGDFNKVTPLHSAAGQSSMEIIKTLLEYGAPKEARDDMDGKTPADWARLSGHSSAAQFIENYCRHSHMENETDMSLDTDSGIYSDADEECQVIEIWQPRFSYFPDYYERRSGLECSQVVSITVGDEKSVISTGILLLRDENTEELSPVW